MWIFEIRLMRYRCETRTVGRRFTRQCRPVRSTSPPHCSMLVIRYLLCCYRNFLTLLFQVQICIRRLQLVFNNRLFVSFDLSSHRAKTNQTDHKVEEARRRRIIWRDCRGRLTPVRNRIVDIDIDIVQWIDKSQQRTTISTHCFFCSFVYGSQKRCGWKCLAIRKLDCQMVTLRFRNNLWCYFNYFFL